MAFIIHLEKESFKFSCTHFTIFGPEKAERMHGHNYHVRVSIETEAIDSQLGMPFDFNLVKPKIKEICDFLDERILVPENSPYIDVKKRSSQIEVRFADRFYSLPEDDVVLLPVVNMTAEELAKYVFDCLKERAHFPSVQLLRVTVEETAGQSVSYEQSFDN